MDLYCIDDSRQDHPSRPGMGKLVAVGGLHVPSHAVRDLERTLDKLCLDTGFPKGKEGEFKWSPGKELWMRDNLKDQARTGFFKTALELAQTVAARAIVVIEDADRGPATKGATPEEDVVRLFLERAHHFLGNYPSRHGIVLADRPHGQAAQEDRFLASCLETLQQGTDYTLPDRIALNVITTSSHLVRLLQLADVVTGCTLAYAAGEKTWSPPEFAVIQPMIREELGRRGGVGLKLQPDFNFANLYHWLLGDQYYVRGGTGHPLPTPHRPYATSPDVE